MYKSGDEVAENPPVHLTTLAAFVALEIVLCFVPGPAVLSVIGATLAGRARAGFATAAGILTGNTIYFVASALGVASAIEASHTVFTAIKWCGAAYLVYLGVRALTTKPEDRSRIVAVPGNAISSRGWVNGTVVQLSNPKALIFFAAILPQFINPLSSVLLQIIILGCASLAVEFSVLALYIGAADRIGRYGFDAKRQLWAERVGGAFLIGVAAAVARAS